MQFNTKTMLTALCIVGVMLSLAHSRYLTSYAYLTDIERTLARHEYYIYFYQKDTLRGPIRSNELLAIKNNPHFYDIVQTPRFERINAGGAFFAFEPDTDLVVTPFPEQSGLQHIADHVIDSDEGFYIIILDLKGDDGIDVSRRRIGRIIGRINEENEFLFTIDHAERQIIYVDGMLEISGIVTGHLTVGSSDDAYLVDNIIYEGASNRNGSYIDLEMEHLFALVSDRNIIIKNNIANGRDNGWDGNMSNQDRHSIILNGAYVALNESFTFENQNDPWDGYSGPTPDERGYIHFKGSLVQKRKNYLIRNNHRYTGYGINRLYDTRLKTIAPPGLEDWLTIDLFDRYDSYVMKENSVKYMRKATIGTLRIEKGTTVHLWTEEAFSTIDTLIINGTPDEPVYFVKRPELGMLNLTLGELTPHSYISMSNAIFADSIQVEFIADTILVNNSIFKDEVKFTGNSYIDSSRFHANVEITSDSTFSFRRNIVSAGVLVNGDVENGEFYNNTIVGNSGIGITLELNGNLDLVNNIIAFNRNGGINLLSGFITQLNYNNVYNPDGENYLNCEPLEGSISANPLFVDAENGDYSLDVGSPCIDAGDPNFALDPDSTRSDIGALYLDRALSVDSKTLPIEWKLEPAFPNPFNSSTRIRFSLPEASVVTLQIIDIQGRLVQSLLSDRVNGGHHNLVWDASGVSAGVYFCKFTVEERSITTKLLLVK